MLFLLLSGWIALLWFLRYLWNYAPPYEVADPVTYVVVKFLCTVVILGLASGVGIVAHKATQRARPMLSFLAQHLETVDEMGGRPRG
jgi:hypothetical protein